MSHAGNLICQLIFVRVQATDDVRGIDAYGRCSFVAVGIISHGNCAIV